MPWLTVLFGKLLCVRQKYSVTKIRISASAVFEKWFKIEVN